MGDLHDEPSAEAYCALGGQIVSPVLAKTIGESCDLREWASFLEPQTTGRGRDKSLSAAVTGMNATPTKVDEKLKKELITILLKVYMSGGCVSPFVVGSDSEFLFFFGTVIHPSTERPGC